MFRILIKRYQLLFFEELEEITIPESSSSHKDLVDIAIQQGILSKELSDKLDQYRGFRHFFVHAYGILLNEEEFRPLTEELPKVWKQFESEIENFCHEPVSYCDHPTAIINEFRFR